jgi:lipopolysaccharide export system protein LptC
MNRSLLGVLVFIFVVGTSLWLWSRREKPEPVPPKPPSSDYILINYTLTALNEEGKENFTVKGPQLQREPGGKALELQMPVFSFPDKKSGRWTASSDSAWVAPKGDEIQLRNNVQMRSPPNEMNHITEFKSNTLRVFPKQDRAETADAVSFKKPGVSLTGVGFKADMNSKRFSILSKVKGRYEPSIR